MFESFKGKHKRIIVGINVKSTNSKIPLFAASMALRTGMTIRLVHVIEYSLLGYPFVYPEGYVTTQIAINTQEELLAEAMKSLEQIKRTIQTSNDINVETNTVVGEVAEVLQADAVATNASLILSGAKATSHKFVPKGLSTALSLMAHSKMPVLIVPEDCSYTFSKGHMKILAADDLTDNSFEAITKACELAFNQGNTDVIHFHVNTQTRSEIEGWAEKIVGFKIQNQLDLEEEFSKANIFEHVSTQIKRTMNKRVGMLRHVIEMATHTNYQQQVRFGNVMDNFLDVVNASKPDLIVFGRHHFIHNKSWAFGKMPFYAMLNLSRPIMIAAGRSTT